jgi:exopolyphosphatase/guanosine-5'-triphosphate,3'-diphosphate pyrophosphatase
MPRSQIDDIFLIDENQEYLRAILPNRKIATNFFQFGVQDVEKIITDLTDKTADEIARAYAMPVETADALLPYMIILKMFFALTQNPHVYILETSLAEAVLANKVLSLELSKRYNKTNQLISVVHSICEQYDVDLDHAKHTVQMTKTLFEGLSGQLGLDENEQLYLTLAAYLHDIGKFVSNRSHHKHSEYVINSLNLFRLTEEEIKIIACVARYHRRGEPAKSHEIYNSLSEEKQIVVQKLASLLRLANALDHSHKQKVKNVQIQGGDSDDITVTIDTKDNFLLEKNDFNEKKDLFEKITGSRIKLVINENF